MEGSAGAAMGAAESSEDVYDPSKDPKRKPRHKEDPGWKYGYWKIIGNRDWVMCTLCGKAASGGIHRHKLHLANTSGDVLGCLKATTEIRKEMIAYLKANAKSKRRPVLLDDDDEEEGTNGVVQVEDNEAEASVAKAPSSATLSRRKKKAFEFKVLAAQKATKVIDLTQTTKPIGITKMNKRTAAEIVDERRTGSYQRTVEACMKTNEERHAVNMEWALFFYECGIPFNAAASRQFQIAVEASCQYGSGYKPPSPHELREPLLDDCVKVTRSLRERHEASWNQFGCTLMSDGWTDRRGRHLINFLANSPEGTFFLESVDASDESHSAPMIAGLLQKQIDTIGRDKVVQVVTDNGANYKAAGKILMDWNPTLFWSPCAAHCLDLMLEDIGKLKAFKKPIVQARRVTTFIYRHGRILSEMRKYTQRLDLVRPGATRFATAFLTLKSLWKHQTALKDLFTSNAWAQAKNLSTSAAGMHVHDIVLSKAWWNTIEDCLRASAPLLIVLRAVDGDEKPAMPEVAAMMTTAKDKIKQGFSTLNKQALLKKIIDIVEKRWVKQMEHPLYGAALFLNPGKFYKFVKNNDDRTVGMLRNSFNEVLARMIPDPTVREVIDKQAIMYEGQRESFANVMAVQNVETRNPIDWWKSYGGCTIELQRFAKRIVSLCAASSGCERNWSTFEFMHTKKRNRLQHQRLNKLVFVAYNRKMANRFRIRREKVGDKSYDPLVVEDFDWDNQWVDASYRPPQGARGCPGDITWEDVDVAVGASEALQGRRLHRGCQRRSRQPLSYSRKQRRTSQPEDIIDVGASEEEAEQEHSSDSNNGDADDLEDFDDDAASEADEGSSDAAENGGNDMDAMPADEFDDGYY